MREIAACLYATQCHVIIEVPLLLTRYGSCKLSPTENIYLIKTLIIFN